MSFYRVKSDMWNAYIDAIQNIAQSTQDGGASENDVHSELLKFKNFFKTFFGFVKILYTTTIICCDKRWWFLKITFEEEEKYASMDNFVLRDKSHEHTPQRKRCLAYLLLSIAQSFLSGFQIPIVVTESVVDLVHSDR